MQTPERHGAPGISATAGFDIWTYNDKFPLFLDAHPRVSPELLHGNLHASLSRPTRSANFAKLDVTEAAEAENLCAELDLARLHAIGAEGI